MKRGICYIPNGILVLQETLPIQEDPVPTVFCDPEDVVPVVMCLFQRVRLLRASLKNLSQQTLSPNIHLYLWNNNSKERGKIERIVARHLSRGGFPVELHHSPKNVGGFGRFYMAQQLAERYPFVVFLDDDQLFATPDELETLFSHRQSRTLWGFWGHRFEGRSYWERIEGKPFQEVQYLGTGGMVADTEIFKQAQCFECPEKFWFVEDVWLSFFASHVLGWQLKKSPCTIDFVDSKGNQWHRLKDLKIEFLEHLRQRGWEV